MIKSLSYSLTNKNIYTSVIINKNVKVCRRSSAPRRLCRHLVDRLFRNSSWCLIFTLKLSLPILIFRSQGCALLDILKYHPNSYLVPNVSA